MGHGAHSRHVVVPVGHDAGSARGPGNIGGTGAQNSAVGALGAAGAELHHRASLGGADHPAGLCGDEALMVDGQQQHGLDKLRLDDGAPHGDDGLTGEDDLPFGDGPHIAFKAEVFQIVQKALGKASPPLQIGDVLIGESQVLQILHQLFHAGHDGVAAVIGYLAEKHIEIRDGILHAVVEVTVGHSELIEIRQHRQVLFHFACLPPAETAGFCLI